MAGFTPDEGKTVRAKLIYNNTDADRGTSLELGLFTNVSPPATITESAITEPTGTGYARKTLADASWTESAGVSGFAKQTFTAGAGGWTGSIQGYFITTTGTTKRLLVIEVDAAGPYTLAENEAYDVTPNITQT